MAWLGREVAWLRARSAAELTLAFALGTFQACALVVVILLLLYPGGSLGETLDDLSTEAGFGLFLVLWLSSVYCTSRALAEIGVQALQSSPLAAMLKQGILWGGASGMMFFLVLVGAFTIYSLGANDDGEPGTLGIASLLLFVGAFGIIGSLVAWVFGGAAGFLFTVLYGLMLQAVRIIVPFPAADKETPRESPERL